MTYRGVVQNGLVILEDASGLRNGQSVDVLPARRDARVSRSRGKKPAPKAPKTKRPKGALPGFGLWRNRVEFADAASAARALRKRSSRRAADA